MAEGSGGASASSSTPLSLLLATPSQDAVRQARKTSRGARLSAQPASPSRNLAMLIQV